MCIHPIHGPIPFSELVYVCTDSGLNDIDFNRGASKHLGGLRDYDLCRVSKKVPIWAWYRSSLQRLGFRNNTR